MNEVTKEDTIRNEHVRGSICVSTLNKMRENRQMVWVCYEKRKIEYCKNSNEYKC